MHVVEVFIALTPLPLILIVVIVVPIVITISILPLLVTPALLMVITALGAVPVSALILILTSILVWRGCTLPIPIPLCPLVAHLWWLPPSLLLMTLTGRSRYFLLLRS